MLHVHTNIKKTVLHLSHKLLIIPHFSQTLVNFSSLVDVSLPLFSSVTSSVYCPPAFQSWDPGSLFHLAFFSMEQEEHISSKGESLSFLQRHKSSSPENVAVVFTLWEITMEYQKWMQKQLIFQDILEDEEKV